MSKSDRNTSKTLSPVAVAVAAIFPMLQSEVARGAENATLAASRSATIVGALVALWDATPAPGRIANGVTVLGDGLKTKESVKGELWTMLHAAGVKSGPVYVTLAHARRVYAELGRADVRKAATESGLRKAYDTAKPAAATETATETSSNKGVPVDIAEFVHRNLDAVLIALRAEFIRCKDPISLAKMGELEMHLASKTSKTA